MINLEKQGLKVQEAGILLQQFTSAISSMPEAFKRLGDSAQPAGESFKKAWNSCLPLYELSSKRREQRIKVKKRFSIIILLLLSIFVQAQTQNIEYLKTLNKCDENFARQFSDLVANNCQTKYQFYGILKSVKRKTYTLVYIPENSTETDKQKIKQYENTKEYQDFEYPGCLSVHFYSLSDGENKDLETKGVEKLKFHSVKSKYLNIFPTWKNLFDPTADEESTLKNFSPKYENIQDKLRFYLKNNNDQWQIINWSN